MNTRSLGMRGWLACAALAALSACGGGGGGADTGTAVSLSVTGKVSDGSALAGATVSAKCQAGTVASTSTGSDGGYTLSMSGVTLPCVLRATSADGDRALHSFAVVTASGAATVNVTAMTELLTAFVTQTTPTAYYDGYTSGSALTAEASATGQAAVKTIVGAAGIDTSGVGDLVGGDASSGSAYSTALEDLKTQLTDSGTTLADVTKTVVDAVGGGASTEDATRTAAETVGTGLGTAATSCAALKSGRFFLVDPAQGVDEALIAVTIDATALTVTLSDGTALSMTQPESCRFALTDPTGAAHDLMVASGGVAVDRITPASGSARVAMLLPRQDLPLSLMGTTWNGLSVMNPDDDAWGSYATTLAFNASGALTSLSVCSDASTCNAADFSGGTLTLSTDANGGFVVTESDGYRTRAVLYRSTAGKLMAVVTDTDGSLMLLTPRNALTMPELNSTSTTWGVSISGSRAMTAGSVTSTTTTVSAVDATAGTFTLTFASDGHTDVRSLNSPWTGFRLRDSAGCKASDGGAYSCSTAMQLPFQGMGLTGSASVGGGLNLSVGQP